MSDLSLNICTMSFEVYENKKDNWGNYLKIEKEIKKKSKHKHNFERRSV